jgi:hypothetical protein
MRQINKLRSPLEKSSMGLSASKSAGRLLVTVILHSGNLPDHRLQAVPAETGGEVVPKPRGIIVLCPDNTTPTTAFPAILDFDAEMV